MQGSGRFKAAAPVARGAAELVLIPFIAGQWSLPVVWYVGEGRGGACLNPLHCGAVVASPLAAGRGRAKEKKS